MSDASDEGRNADVYRVVSYIGRPWIAEIVSRSR